MITEERIRGYILSLEQPKEEILEDIRKEALSQGVPIIRPEEEALLSFFMDLLRPKKVLEVGCAVGYSGILMAKKLPDMGHLTTMENYEPRILKARENFARTGTEDRITLLTGDATEHLRRLSEEEPGSFDLIFMDAAKAQYIVWLPDILKLMSEKSVLISDNVLQDGDVLESRFAVDRRDRTIHSRMREYLHELKTREDLSTSILPLGDGVAVTTKI